MLSVFDLIEAGTLDLDLAAFLMAHIMRGASFMVGALPGGAGKTTVMGALLNFAPKDVHLCAADARTMRAALGSSTPRRCYICHEIGSGPYYAYLWDKDLRAYCALAGAGHMLSTNLHADYLDEARNQVCCQNGVPEVHFRAFRLVLFLRVQGGYCNARRWVESVHITDGVSPHAPVYTSAAGIDETVAVACLDPAWRSACRSFLEVSLASGLRTNEETRAAILSFPG
jgi:hypothetical protein